DDCESRLIVMANELTQEVVPSSSCTLVHGLVGTATITIFEPLTQRHGSRAVVPSPNPREPMKEAVSLQEQCAFGVTPLDSIAQDIRNRVVPAGVDALHAPSALSQIKNVADSYTSQGVSD